jgi:formylglycine-generating enzyme required for sulfatase activity
MSRPRTLHLVAAASLTLLAGVTLAAAPAIQDCAHCPRVLPVAPGKFMMGQAGNPATLPRHAVAIGYRYAMGETEVTLDQFRYFVQRSGYAGGSSDDGRADARLPATGVDWFAARAYTRWLSRHTGQRYRLPSEAEWEFAARAGTSSRYWWGESGAAVCGKEQVQPVFHGLNDAPCAQADNAALLPVASMRANPWGFYDMLGNADEWMADCPPTGAIGYAGTAGDGKPFKEQCTYFNDARVVRRALGLGGDSARERVDPVTAAATIGFRVVRELP